MAAGASSNRASSRSSPEWHWTSVGYPCSPRKRTLRAGDVLSHVSGAGRSCVARRIHVSMAADRQDGCESCPTKSYLVSPRDAPPEIGGRLSDLCEVELMIAVAEGVLSRAGADTLGKEARQRKQSPPVLLVEQGRLARCAGSTGEPDTHAGAARRVRRAAHAGRDCPPGFCRCIREPPSARQGLAQPGSARHVETACSTCRRPSPPDRGSGNLSKSAIRPAGTRP